MPSESNLEEPRELLVAAFKNPTHAAAARDDLTSPSGTDPVLMVGNEDGSEIETQPVWFADTDEDLRRFHDVLKAGGGVLAIHAESDDAINDANRVCHEHSAAFVFYFGTIATVQLDTPQHSTPT